MSDDTKIEWTDATWNPVRGCSRVSEGCRNCYAEKVAARFSGPGLPYEGLAEMKDGKARWTGEVRLIPEHLADPIRWTKPRRIFVNSMSDLFHDKLTNREIAAVFGVMAASPQHTFQVLTKRPQRMLDWFKWVSGIFGKDAGGRAVRMDVNPILSCTAHASDAVPAKDKDAVLRAYNGAIGATWPLRNVWLGVSTEDQYSANERVPILMQVPAVVHYVSAEPLISGIDFEAIPFPDAYLTWKGVVGVMPPVSEKETEPDDYVYFTRLDNKLNWVIVGGESGTNARLCNVQWIRSIVEQCKAAAVPVFVKQLGARPSLHDDEPVSLDKRWPISDRKGSIQSEWPSDLRVRQFPWVGEPVREGGKDFTGCDV